MELKKEYKKSEDFFTSEKVKYYYIGPKSIEGRQRKLFSGREFDYAKPFMNGCSFVFENGVWNVILEDGSNFFEDIHITKERTLSNEEEELANHFDNLFQPIIKSREIFFSYVTEEVLIILKCLASPNNRIIKNYRVGQYFILTVELSKLKVFEKYFPYTYPAEVYDKVGFILVGEYFNFLTDDIYEDVGLLSQGLQPVKRFGANWQYLKYDEESDCFLFEETIEPQLLYHDFKKGYSFSGGLAKVIIGEKFGFINQTGFLKIDPQFDDAKSFKMGFAPVAFINYGNLNLDDLNLDELEPDEQAKIKGKLRNNLKWNVIDLKGEIIFKKYYSEISIISQSIFIVKDVVFSKIDNNRVKRNVFYRIINRQEDVLLSIDENDIEGFFEGDSTSIVVKEFMSIFFSITGFDFISYQGLGSINRTFISRLYFNQKRYIDKSFYYDKVFDDKAFYNTFVENPLRIEFDSTINEESQLFNLSHIEAWLELSASCAHDAESERRASGMYNDELDSWGGDWGWNVE
jgi:hypothetical protein